MQTQKKSPQINTNSGFLTRHENEYAAAPSVRRALMTQTSPLAADLGHDVIFKSQQFLFFFPVVVQLNLWHLSDDLSRAAYIYDFFNTSFIIYTYLFICVLFLKVGPKKTL